MEYRFISRNEEETVYFAEQLYSKVFPGCLIALDGDLGAGKTMFSRAFAKAMGVSSNVNSPTFTIIKEYMGKQWPLYHMDVYRISLEEADELGLEEYFEGDGIVLIEWASLIEPLLPDQRLSVFIDVDIEGTRVFKITPQGNRYLQICETMKEQGVF